MTYSQYDRLISFDSIHQAIKAEKLLDRHGLQAVVLPTPREIDLSCGQCLLFAAREQAAVLEVFAAAKVRWSKLFSRTPAGSVYIYEKLTEYGGLCGTTADT